MVEGAPLLREYTRKGIVGSNPIFSAIHTVIDFIEILRASVWDRTQRRSRTLSIYLRDTGQSEIAPGAGRADGMTSWSLGIATTHGRRA